MSDFIRRIDLNTWLVILGLAVSFVGHAYTRDFRIRVVEQEQASLQTSIRALTAEVSALKLEIASLRSYYQGREGLPPKQ